MNIVRIEEHFYVSPQLAPEHMPALAEAGIRSVINNRPDFEARTGQPTSAELEQAARAAGLEYRHLPVPPAGHGEGDAREMVRLVEALPAPVLAFCGSGRRAAALYAFGRGLPGQS